MNTYLSIQHLLQETVPSGLAVPNSQYFSNAEHFVPSWGLSKYPNLHVQTPSMSSMLSLEQTSHWFSNGPWHLYAAQLEWQISSCIVCRVKLAKNITRSMYFAFVIIIFRISF